MARRKCTFPLQSHWLCRGATNGISITGSPHCCHPPLWRGLGEGHAVQRRGSGTTSPNLLLPGNWMACSNSQPERTLSLSTKILQENDQKMQQLNEYSIFSCNSIRDKVGYLCLKPRPLFEEDIWVHLSWMNPITLLTNSKEVFFFSFF